MPELEIQFSYHVDHHQCYITMGEAAYAFMLVVSSCFHNVGLVPSSRSSWPVRRDVGLAAGGDDRMCRSVAGACCADVGRVGLG
jgi:hypothetical protein